MIVVNSGESYLGAEIREWCSRCKEQDAVMVNTKYYSGFREPNDGWFYFVQKDGENFSNYSVVGDLVKSPRL